MTTEDLLRAGEEFGVAALQGRRVAIERAAARVGEWERLYPALDGMFEIDTSAFDYYVDVSCGTQDDAIDVIFGWSLTYKKISHSWAVRVRTGSQQGPVVYERHCNDPIAQLAAMADWVREGHVLEGWMG